MQASAHFQSQALTGLDSEIVLEQVVSIQHVVSRGVPVDRGATARLWLRADKNFLRFGWLSHRGCGSAGCVTPSSLMQTVSHCARVGSAPVGVCKLGIVDLATTVCVYALGDCELASNVRERSYLGCLHSVRCRSAEPQRRAAGGRIRPRDAAARADDSNDAFEPCAPLCIQLYKCI